MEENNMETRHTLFLQFHPSSLFLLNCPYPFFPYFSNKKRLDRLPFQKKDLLLHSLTRIE